MQRSLHPGPCPQIVVTCDAGHYRLYQHRVQWQHLPAERIDRVAAAAAEVGLEAAKVVEAWPAQRHNGLSPRCRGFVHDRSDQRALGDHFEDLRRGALRDRAFASPAQQAVLSGCHGVALVGHTVSGGA